MSKPGKPGKPGAMVPDGLGALGPEKQADKKTQALCDELKKNILEKPGKDGAQMFKALKYRDQLVEGLNSFVKIQIDSGGECVHAKIFTSLPTHGKTFSTLGGVQTGKRVDDPIEYF